MKLDKFWERYKEYTLEVTQHSRKLGFAAAAICWFFKTQDFTFPPLILLSLTSIVMFFSFDLLQYIVAAARTKRFAREEEEKAWRERKTVDVEIHVPESLDRPVQKLFLVKIVALFSSFILLIAEFIKRL